MTEPIRLLDDTSAPEEAAALLRSLSAPIAPSLAKQAELSKQLASLANPATAGAGAAPSSGTAVWLKAGFVCGVLGLGALALVRLGAHSPSPTPSVSAASVAPPLPASTAAVAPGAPVLVQPPIASQPETPSPPASSAHAKGTTRDSLAAEEALLEQARRAATASPSQSLALLKLYQRRFPNGQLTAERRFLAVDVLTRLGNPSAARREADALIRAFPNSVYAAQVKAQSSTPAK